MRETAKSKQRKKEQKKAGEKKKEGWFMDGSRDE